MIKTAKEDIFLMSEDILIHQVNCRGIMGSGLAKEIKARHPEVFDGYIKHIKDPESGMIIPAWKLLGTICLVKVNVARYTVANCFGQDGYGVTRRHTEYDAVKKYMIALRETGRSIAIPYKIGCGLGGGDWRIVSEIITDVFNDYNNDVVIYKK